MTDELTRRRFIKNSAAVGASVTIGGGLLGEFAGPVLAGESKVTKLAAVTGPDPFKNTLAAVDTLGGITRYVREGSRVVINANTAFKHRGTIVDPNVLLAALTMCAVAGAKEVWLLKGVPGGYWKRSDRAANHQQVIDSAKISEQDFKVVKIAKGVALTEAHVDRRLLDADVYLNISIAKHHAGSEFTGTLKNAMGACPHEPTCRFFHFGSNTEAEGWYEDVDHLSQCVADLNLVRKPDLCILDASEILTSNGPFGPGKLASPKTVVASVDPVAADSYGARFLGLQPDAVTMIGRSQRHGLGNADLKALEIHESKLG